jgi:predicted Zn finger-like uncharacterized protein
MPVGAQMLGKAYCPHCHASFNIGEEHLEAEHTLVRCGRCLETFDVRDNFVAPEPHTQLELPIPHSDLDFTVDHADSAPATPVEFDIEQDRDESLDEIWLDEETPAHFANVDDAYLDDSSAEEAEFAQVVAQVETLLPSSEEAPDAVPESAAVAPAENLPDTEQPVEYEFAKKANPAWPWAIAASLLLLALLLQATYAFRVELAANFPPTKPLLVSACELLNCNIPLPRQANLMSIESSDLADTPQGHVVLHALLRNHATYAQAFPNLELTLTDTTDNPLARRIFGPADYLSHGENEAAGLPPNQEISIKLLLDTSDIKPSGYRLALFYPEN